MRVLAKYGNKTSIWEVETNDHELARQTVIEEIRTTSKTTPFVVLALIKNPKLPSANVRFNDKEPA